MLDYEIQRCTRHCHKTGRELSPGETFYTALLADGGAVVRHDFAAEAWDGPPERAIGWWKSHVPVGDAKRASWAPNDVMLELFESLGAEPAQQDFRYVLTLLLIRRRVLRMDETERDPAGPEVLSLHCPKRETDYRVAVVMPTPEREAEIQRELERLLMSGGGAGK